MSGVVYEEKVRVVLCGGGLWRERERGRERESFTMTLAHVIREVEVQH